MTPSGLDFPSTAIDFRGAHLRMGWTAGSSLLSRLIQRHDFAEVDGVRIRSGVNHVLLHWVFPDGSPSWVFESGRHGIAWKPWANLERALDSGKVVKLIEARLGMDEWELTQAWERAVALHGRGYDWAQLYRYRIWTRYFRKRLKGIGKKILSSTNPKRFTCNEAATHVLRGLVQGIPLDADNRFTPEGLFVALMGRPSAHVIRDRMNGRKRIVF
jgi:hypothetical protein